MDRGETVREGTLSARLKTGAVSEWIRRALPAAVAGTLGLLFASASLPGEISPFGIAFLSAVTGLPEAVAALAGCLVGSLTTRWPIGYALVYLAVFGGRLLVGYLLRGAMLADGDRFRFVRPWWKKAGVPRSGGEETLRRALFGENVPLRAAIAAAAMLSAGVFTVALGDAPVRDFLLSLLSAVLCPAVTASLCGVTERRFALSGERVLGEAVLAALVVFSLREISVFGVSLGCLAAAAIPMYVSRCEGAPVGSVAGFLCGMVFEPLYAPAFAAAAIASGVLWHISPIMAAAGGCLAGATWATWAFHLEGLRAVVPGLTVASALLGPLFSGGVLPVLRLLPEKIVREDAGSGEAALVEEARRERYRAMVTDLSESLRSASGIFEKLSRRRRRPPTAELRAMCDEAFDRACRRCGYAGVCWQKEYDATADVLSSMTAALRKNGRVTAETVPEYLLARCCQMERIITDVNDGCARRTAEAIREDKASVAASDYGLMARLLSETTAREDAALAYDAGASERLRRGLREADFSAGTISVYGTRRRLILARPLDMAHVRMGGDDLRAAAERALGSSFSPPEFSISGDCVTMTMHSVPMFRAECGRCSAAGGREENGDAVSSFTSRDGYYYALVSDGMGSGREAALASRVSAVFLERMLSSGAPLETSLEMLHGFLRTGSTECSATVDLMEFDLYTGEARFLKSGAAPSFVLRAGRLFRLESKTAPIGIMKALDAELLSFRLRRGDVVVMLSDGVTPSYEEAVWLMDMLCREEEWDDDLRAMAEKIVRRARENTPRPDDASVSLIRIA